MAAALAESMHKPLPWAVGFFFGNVELSMAVAGDYNGFAQCRRIEITLIRRQKPLAPGVLFLHDRFRRQIHYA